MDRGDEYFSVMAAEKLREKGPSEGNLMKKLRGKGPSEGELTWRGSLPDDPILHGEPCDSAIEQSVVVGYQRCAKIEGGGCN